MESTYEPNDMVNLREVQASVFCRFLCIRINATGKITRANPSCRDTASEVRKLLVVRLIA